MNQISTITEDYTRQDQRLKFEMTVTKKFEMVTKNATCGDLVVTARTKCKPNIFIKNESANAVWGHS